MTCFLLMLSLLQAPGVSARTAHDGPILGRTATPVVVVEENATGLTVAQQKALLRRFEDRFNRLVMAVEEFSQAYNGGRGQVWPAEKAAALRKAMEELQKAEQSLKAQR